MKTVFRSLSSLLFLSMGIFLLNSVNELVESGGLPEGKYCSTYSSIPVAVKHCSSLNVESKRLWM
jgi:hypothetical protein